MTLGMADPGQAGAVWHELLVQPKMLVDRPKQRDLIVVIIDRELAREAGANLAKRGAVAPQQPHAKGVERGNERSLTGRAVAQQAFDYALAHLLGRFVGESHGQNGRPGYVLRLDQVRDAMRDDARLAAAGAGKQQQRTFDMRNGIALLGV